MGPIMPFILMLCSLLANLHSSDGTKPPFNLLVVYDGESSARGALDGVMAAERNVLSPQLADWNPSLGSIALRTMAITGKEDLNGLCSMLMGDGPSKAPFPDLVIDVTFRNNNLSSLVSKLNLMTVSSNLFPRKWSPPATDRSRVVHLKSPTRMLVEVVRDAISEFYLNEKHLRILYDTHYDHAIGNLMEELHSIYSGSNLELVSITELEEGEVDFVKKVRKLRKPAVSSFLVLADKDTIQRLSRAIKLNDMFRSQYTWVFVTKDKRQIECDTCKHASFLVMQPSVCHLHEYEYDLPEFDEKNLPLSQRVDYYYYHDLTILAVKSMVQSLGSVSPSPSLPKVSPSMCSSPGPLPPHLMALDLTRSMFNLSGDFHGKYGEFIIYSPDDVDVTQTSKSNYQDEEYEIREVTYMNDRRTSVRKSSWYYQEPTGSFLYRAYDEEGKSEPAKKEEPATTASDDGKEATTEEPKADGDGEAGQTPSPPGYDCGTPQEDAEVGPIAPFQGIVFILYHHPPFVYVNSENWNNNDTAAFHFQLGNVPKLMDKNERNFHKGVKPEYQYSNNMNATHYFSGFMVEMLEEMIQEYGNIYKGDKFPEYRLMLSTDFIPTATGEDAASSNGGFGYKELPKEDKKDKKDGDSADKGPVFWGGMMSEVMCSSYKRGKREPVTKVILMPMTPTPERRLSMDFSEPFFDSVSLSIMMKKPVLLYHYWKFVTVLEYSVWICITGAYFFTSLLLWFFDRSSPYSYRNDPDRYKNDVEKRFFTIKESLWFCITSLTPQGGGEAPKALSGRLVAATWWLFGFIVIASYTANLAAFLTVSRLDHPINSFTELTKQYKIKYAPFDGSSTKAFFERMAKIEEQFYQVWKNLSLNDDLTEDERAKLAVWDYPISDRFTKIWAAMTEATPYKGLNDAMKKVKDSKETGKEGAALVAEAPIINYAVDTNCDLVKVGGDFLPRPNSLAYAKNTKHKEVLKKLDKVIYNLKENGAITRMRKKWWYDKVTEQGLKKKCYEHRKLYNGITLENAGGIFMVIAIGVILTVICLWIENWYYGLKMADDARKAKLPAITAMNANPSVIKKRKCAIQ